MPTLFANPSLHPGPDVAPHEPVCLSGTLEVRVVGCRDLPETIPWNPSPSVGGPGTPESRTPFLSRPARGLYSRSGSLSGRSSLKAEAENTSEWALKGWGWGGGGILGWPTFVIL